MKPIPKRKRRELQGRLIREERLAQQRLAGELFGVDVKEKIEEIELNNEKDFLNYAKLVNLKLAHAKSRSFQVSFLIELIRGLDSSLRAEDYQTLQQQINVLLNSKIKTEKGKDKKKKAKG